MSKFSILITSLKISQLQIRVSWVFQSLLELFCAGAAGHLERDRHHKLHIYVYS